MIFLPGPAVAAAMHACCGLDQSLQRRVRPWEYSTTGASSARHAQLGNERSIMLVETLHPMQVCYLAGIKSGMGLSKQAMAETQCDA